MEKITLYDIQKHLSHLSNKLASRPKMEFIINNSGDTISIQASEYHYSIPRELLASGKYTHVEVGLPTIVPPESWEEYCE